MRLTVLCLTARNVDNCKCDIDCLCKAIQQLTDNKQSLITSSCAGDRATGSCITDRALARPAKANTSSDDRLLLLLLLLLLLFIANEFSLGGSSPYISNK